MDTSQALEILSEFGVKAVPAKAHPAPGQTKAVVNLQRIIDRRGYEHARLLVMFWKETNLRRTIMDESSLWAFSDLILAAERNFPELMSNNMELLFSFLDGLQLAWLQDWSRDLDGIMPRRYAIAAQVYERMKRLFGVSQKDFFDDRARRVA